PRGQRRRAAREGLSLIALPAGRDRMRSALLAWAGLGLFAFVLLPWHLAADKTLVESLRNVFAADDSASGLRAAATLHRPWLWIGLAGLVLAAAGALASGRT